VETKEKALVSLAPPVECGLLGLESINESDIGTSLATSDTKSNADNGEDELPIEAAEVTVPTCLEQYPLETGLLAHSLTQHSLGFLF